MKKKVKKQYYSVYDNDTDPSYKGWAAYKCPFRGWRSYNDFLGNKCWGANYQSQHRPFKLELWQAKEWYRYLCVKWKDDGDDANPPYEVRRIPSKKEAAELKRREKFAMKYL